MARKLVGQSLELTFKGLQIDRSDFRENTLLVINNCWEGRSWVQWDMPAIQTYLDLSPGLGNPQNDNSSNTEKEEEKQEELTKERSGG